MNTTDLRELLAERAGSAPAGRPIDARVEGAVRQARAIRRRRQAVMGLGAVALVSAAVFAPLLFSTPDPVPQPAVIEPNEDGFLAFEHGRELIGSASIGPAESTATATEVFGALRSTNAELGTTVVIVTHDPAVAEHVDRTVAIRDGRTSSEVLRRTEITADGHERVIAEEYAVLDRAGRVQLPRDFVTTLGLRERVRLELEPDHLGVWQAQTGNPGDRDEVVDE